MSPAAKRCPGCGAVQPATAPEGLCPRCLMRLPMTDDTPVPAHADATKAPATTGPGHSPEQTPGDPEATGAHIAGSVASTAPVPHDATQDWRPDPNLRTRTFDGHEATSALPHGATVRYFGDYEVQKELGRGGMGVVYKARQVSLNRLVALKMIKAGALADDAELRRFRNEAEAVALLDHAGIVPVYEVGEHDGQNYFSMKLVEGGNLADQLLTFKANPRTAATLLAETAEAVHHAHMRGILHRDLKPANILVDAEGHPHVTDFGLAKLIESDVELTASGAIMGTPSYMSPEQAAGRRGSITTATDVYGLGAILYSVLTGKAPFGGESLMDTLDAVRSRPPEPPTRLNDRVPHDLETICLKALEKDPRKRYASAQALADDLRNWLASRPIAARRVGSVERAWLWCKRRPAVAALAAAAVMAIVVGTAAVIAVQSRANRMLAKKNLDLQASNTSLDQQRRRAENRESQAIQAVSRFRDVIVNEPALKNSPALGDLRKKLLKEPQSFFRSLRDRLQADQDTRPESLARLAEACVNLGLLADEIGDKQDALAAQREALAIYRRLVELDPGPAPHRNGEAGAFYNIGSLLDDLGKPDEALEAYQSAQQIQQELADAHPSDPIYRRTLAGTYGNVGTLLQDTKPAESLKAHRMSLELMQGLVDADPANTDAQLCVALCHVNIGVLLRNGGKLDEALEEYRSARAIYKTLVAADPSDTRYQSYLAHNDLNRGNLLGQLGRRGEGMKAYESCRSIMQGLVDGHPAVTEFRDKLAQSQYNIGLALSEAGEPDEALKAYRSALAIRERLATEHPGVPDFASDLGATLHNIVMIEANRGLFEESRVRLRQAVEWQGKALTRNPAHPTYRDFMTNHLTALAYIANRLGRREESARSQRALNELRAGPARTDALKEAMAALLAADESADAGAARLIQAQQAYGKGRFADAVRLWDEALKADPKLADDRQAQLRYNASCAAALAAAGNRKDSPKADDAARAKLREQALGWLNAELAIWSKFVESGPPQAKAFIAQTLRHWQEDTDLATIRDEKELAKLTEAERKEWKTLWADVDALLAKVTGGE
jgi:serine/threonine protein kinase